MSSAYDEEATPTRAKPIDRIVGRLKIVCPRCPAAPVSPAAADARPSETTSPGRMVLPCSSFGEHVRSCPGAPATCPFKRCKWGGAFDDLGPHIRDKCTSGLSYAAASAHELGHPSYDIGEISHRERVDKFLEDLERRVLGKKLEDEVKTYVV